MAKTEGHFPGALIRQGVVSVVEGEHIAHWELANAIYHVSFHLADSVPTSQLLAWREARREFAVRRTANPAGELSPEEIAEFRRLYDERIERYLTAGHGCCALRTPGLAERVAKVFEHGHGVTHDLHVLMIMPNHVHVIAALLPGHEMKKVVDGWKSVSAHLIAKSSGMKAPIWQPDHYSRIIRTPEEYQRQDRYVWYNPESARLTSGFFRKRY